MSAYYQLQTAKSFQERFRTKYSVDALLSDKYLFDTFIHDLAGLGLDNASGGSYRQVFLGYYSEGVLLGSQHSSYCYCQIQIASKPNSKWHLGDQDSRCSGDPSPTLEEGEWVNVWSYSDCKLKEGPWCQKVKDVLQKALDKAEQKSLNLLEQEQIEMQSKQDKEEEFKKELVENWETAMF